MRQRHWDQISELTKHEMNVNDPEFRLADMLAAKLVSHQVCVHVFVRACARVLAVCLPCSALYLRIAHVPGPVRLSMNPRACTLLLLGGHRGDL
jgi:hypothetical protein